ncbi:MAG: helix-turn-helix domain-containing protein [Armatimonadota bacterium]
MRNARYVGFGIGHEHDRCTTAHRVLRLHGTDSWILVFTLGGRGKIHEQNGMFFVDPGDMLLIPAGVYQELSADRVTGQWEHIWACFTPRVGWQESLLLWPKPIEHFGKLTIVDVTLRERLQSRLEIAVALGCGPLKRREEFVMNIIEEVLLWCETQNPLAAEAQLDTRINQALHYLCQHLHEPVHIQQLAELCHLSPSRFAHLFLRQVGQTPLQYLETQRIARARTLLIMTDAPICHIADQCGFSNPSYFNRIFKRHLDVPPTAFRKQFTQ